MMLPRLAVSVALTAFAAGCGGSSSSSSKSTSTPAPTSTAATTSIAKTLGAAPSASSLRVGQACSPAKQSTYKAHGFTCAGNHLKKVLRGQSSGAGAGSSGGAPAGGGSTTGSGGAPISGY